VDEYQDFSRMETEFIAVLATRNQVLIAGDDDQALYSFKHASSRYLRALAADRTYERFELPFCSRCTLVIVNAVNDVIQEAQRRGRLAGRIAKPFECYLPDKAADSGAHPRIIVANCSVERRGVPYMGRYVAAQIGRIPEADIRESHEQGYPTVLVIGRKPFLDAVARTVSDIYPQTLVNVSTQPEVERLDGYRRLAADDQSRLGWRILAHTAPFENVEDALRRVGTGGAEVVDIVPDVYRNQHLAIVRILRRLIEREALDDADQQILERAVGLSLNQIRDRTTPEAETVDDTPNLADADAHAAAATPSIVCTSLVGAKGLSAGYVFVVGFVDGSIPEDPRAITDDEVCSLIVALSRTRKECHLVSCGNFGGQWFQPSTFVRWIQQPVDSRVVDRTYWRRDA
jgi:hypothetical protein